MEEIILAYLKSHSGLYLMSRTLSPENFRHHGGG